MGAGGESLPGTWWNLQKQPVLMDTPVGTNTPLADSFAQKPALWNVLELSGTSETLWNALERAQVWPRGPPAVEILLFKEAHSDPKVGTKPRLLCGKRARMLRFLVSPDA